jgi:lipoprotein-anchoring transpeptidase ErfK/SrfK
MSIGVGRVSAGRRTLAVGCVLVLAVLAGCGGSDAAAPASPQRGGTADRSTDMQAVRTVPAARLAFRPGDGAHDVSPLTPVVVRAAGGTLGDVAVRNVEGRSVKGRLSADRRTWTSTEPLGYSRSYAVTAVATNSAGRQTSVTSRFSTLTPATFTMPYLFPSGRVGRVGVGQPITVHFDEPVADKAAAEQALRVTATPATQGGWNWFDNQSVHWRPRTYWKPGTKVTVEANVYGVHVGNGIYGEQDVSTSFTVGPSRIATVDDRTHMMTVRISGNVVRRIPVSMGRGGSVTVKGKTIYFTTQSGPHVVQEKYPIKEMSSESYGLPVDDPLGYKEKIPLAVRVSGDGEFVHAASWSVADQGVRNVSHGCINISPDNAKWFYKTFSYGDIVDIKHTGVLLRPGNKYGDWMVSWADWVAGSALG